MKKKTSNFITGVIEAITSQKKLTSSGSNTFKLGATTFTSRQFIRHYLETEDATAKFLGRTNYYPKIAEVAENKGISEADASKLLAEDVYEAILNKVKHEARKKTTGNTAETASKGYKYENKLPILDRKSSATLLFDAERKCIDYQTSYDTWMKYRLHQPKEVKDMMSMAVTVADIAYDPYESMEYDLRHVNGQDDVLTINAHVMPAWRKKEIENPKLPKMFKDVLNHLFSGDKDSIEYVLSWLYFAIVERNHCILLLHGGRGVGKGTFQSIACQLVGPANFGLMPSGFFESRFNEPLRFKRVVCFDDFSIKREFMSEWKQLPESYVSIEAKGQDAVTYKNHASFIVSNNSEDEVALLGDERKFSVPLCEPTVKIEDALGKDEMHQFVRDIADNEEMIANIGWWILKNANTGKYTNVHPFLSEVFYEIADKALTNWQRGIIEEIERCEWKEINLQDIQDITKGTGRTKIEKFLASHKDREGDIYGTIRQIKGGERVIIPSDKYLPPDEPTAEKEEDDIYFTDVEF